MYSERMGTGNEVCGPLLKACRAAGGCAPGGSGPSDERSIGGRFPIESGPASTSDDTSLLSAAFGKVADWQAKRPDSLTCHRQFDWPWSAASTRKRGAGDYRSELISGESLERGALAASEGGSRPPPARPPSLFDGRVCRAFHAANLSRQPAKKIFFRRFDARLLRLPRSCSRPPLTASGSPLRSPPGPRGTARAPGRGV